MELWLLTPSGPRLQLETCWATLQYQESHGRHCWQLYLRLSFPDLWGCMGFCEIKNFTKTGRQNVQYIVQEINPIWAWGKTNSTGPLGSKSFTLWWISCQTWWYRGEMVSQVHWFRFRGLSIASKSICFALDIIAVSEAERMGWEEGAGRRSVEPHGDTAKQMQNSSHKYIQWKDWTFGLIHK